MKMPDNLLAPLYAAVFALEYERQYRYGNLGEFQDGWRERCAVVAHEHAEQAVQAYERAMLDQRIR